MLLSRSLLTVSETVVSSTYFHRSDPGMSRSLIIIANSHGPSFVPCGTPAGTAPHSEKQSELSRGRERRGGRERGLGQY